MNLVKFSGVFLLLFFILLFKVISHPGPFPFDIVILNLVMSWRTPVLNHIILLITYIGKGEIVTLGVIIISLFFFLNKQKFYFKIILSSVIGAETLIQIIKTIINRPRPPHFLSLITETTPSFPSGHSFVVFYFYSLLAYIVFKQTNNKKIKITAVFVAILIVILVSLSRIYLGVHWPTDVLGSWFLGFAWLFLFISFISSFS